MPPGARLLLLTIVAVGAALRLYGIRMGLPHLLARPDEYTIVDRIRPLFAGHLDPNYYVYPSLYLYLVAAWIRAGIEVLNASILHLGYPPGMSPGGYLTIYWARPDVLILIGRIGHALLGTAIIVLAAWVARGLGGPMAALAAAAIVATNVLLVRDSHALKADIALAAACLVACAAFARLATEPDRRNAALAGLAFALALGAKQTAVLLVFPFLVAVVLAARSAPAGTAAANGSRAGAGRRRAALATILVAAAVTVVAVAATNPFLMLNLFGQEMQFIWYGLIDPTRLNLPPTPLGEAPVPLSGRYLYHLQHSLLGGSGVAFTVLAAVALVRAALGRDTTPRILAAFVVSWAAVICASSQRYSRYLTPTIPALAVLIGGLLAEMITSPRLALRSGARRLVMTAAVALVVAEPLFASLELDRLSARPDTRVAARQWLAEHAAPGQVVLAVGTRFWGFGSPQMPTGVRLVTAPEGPLTPETLDESHASFVLTHWHPRLPFSAGTPEMLAPVAGRLTEVFDLDPFVPGVDPGLYEPQDALYMPLRGASGVKQPGPRIRIYRVAG